MQNEDKTAGMFELVEQWQQSGKSQQQFSSEQNIKLAQNQQPATNTIHSLA